MMGHRPLQTNAFHALLRLRITNLLTLVAASSAAFVCFLLTLPAAAAPHHKADQADAHQAETHQPDAPRDGRHDFDFNIGVWHTHIRRAIDPFADAKQILELNGTVTVRKIWDGRAQLEEIEADGPKGHWEGLSLFLYNPAAHQWSQSFINSRIADLGSPLVGEFKDGRAELFSSDTFNGKSIIVKAVWSNIVADAHRYEEWYSNDGGKTWALSFTADLTRDEHAATQDGTAIADPSPVDTVPGGHDFDFDFGTWKIHSERLLHPLTGSHDWVDMDGTTTVAKVWGGRANLAEYDAVGTGGHVTLLALRWFNPTTHEWNLDFATPGVGTLGIPGSGAFKNGRADFYDYEPINGRSVLVRFSIWSVKQDSIQSEQAFSDDGGKTWEVNWINKYQRASPQ
jgi:hypothetical protein